MPYYRCYRTKDDKYMAVGCIEPQFFAIMLEILKIGPDEFGGQNNPKEWPAQHATLEAVFATKTRNDWAALFDGTDACVTPVLNYLEAAEHPQNKARGGLTQNGPYIHPAPTPKFQTYSQTPNNDILAANSHRDEILAELGYDEETIATFKAASVIKP
jgi:alpha-methylacyl-CoA racemase